MAWALPPHNRPPTICLSAKETDGILLILSPQFIADPAGTAACLGRVLAQKRVPVLVAWMGGRRVSPGRRVLDDAGIPT